MTQIPIQSTSQDSLNEPSAPGAAAQASAKLSLLRKIGGGKLSQRSATLARQLLNTVLPLALTPLLVASVAGYIITEQRTQTRITEKLKGEALLTSDNLNQEIQKDLEELDALVTSPFILDEVREAAAQAEADGLPEQSIEALEAQFSATRQIAPNPVLNDYLVGIAASGTFDEILITEANGFMVGFNQPSSDFVQYDERWWQQGKAQAAWIGEPEFDASTNTFGVSLVRRIEDPSTGDFLGVLDAFVSSRALTSIGDALQNIGISGTQQVQILDLTSGFTLASYSEEGTDLPDSVADAAEVTGGRTVAEIATAVLDANRSLQATTVDGLQESLAAAYPINDVVVESITDEASQNLVLTFNFEGRRYSLSPLSQISWVAISSMEIAEIQAEGRQLLTVFGLIAAVLGGLAAVLTFGLSKQLSSPLNSLSDKARQVSDGDLNVRAELKGSAETQGLAQTFNDLVQQVQASLDEQIQNSRQSALFAEITGTPISTTEDLTGLFDRVVEQAREFLQADRVVFYQFGKNWEGQITNESMEENLPSAFHQGLNDPCIPEETRNKYLADEILQVDNVEAAEFHPAHRQLLDNLNVNAILAVAIQNQGQLYGLVIAHHCDGPYRWQPGEIDFLRQLGRQVGLVIERVKLLEETGALAEEQRQIKEGLQRSALQLLMEVDPVSQGDLTVRARVTENEIGTIADSYNATISSLRKIVTQVQKAAAQVGSTTEANDQSIRKLSTSALQQANDIATALDRAQEMADSVRQVADNAKTAEQAVQEASQTVQEGDEAMNRTVDGILAIRETVAETAKKVKRLGESSQKISNVVNLISGFAAQTNMLALNASIEASRAGEGGKGFAVVAEEVRELARQSAEATSEIEKLVASIQTETNDVVLAMEEGTQQVVDGTKLVDETRQSLNRITAASEQISVLVEAITQTTSAQSVASEAVTVTMTNVAEIANQNSQEANQVSSSFEALNTVAQALQEEVGRFKVS